MGTIVSISGPLRKLTWLNVLEHKSNFDYGRPFVEMIRDHPYYGKLIEMKTTFEIHLVHRESHHWYLLAKTKDSTLPYISLEIRTTNLRDLVPFTCNVDSPKCDVSSNVGYYAGSLISLCELADTVVTEMGSYELIRETARHFAIYF